jgi:hypothetical protein
VPLFCAAGIPQFLVMLSAVENCEVQVALAIPPDPLLPASVTLDMTVSSCGVHVVLFGAHAPSGMTDVLSDAWTNAESETEAWVDVVESLHVPVSPAPSVFVPLFGEPAVLLVTGRVFWLPAGLVGVSNTVTLYNVPIPVFFTVPFTG